MITFAKNSGMKYLLTIVACASLFTACLNNTDKERVATAGMQASKRDSANFTKIEWLDSAKHLGSIKQGEVLKIDYHFRNEIGRAHV